MSNMKKFKERLKDNKNKTISGEKRDNILNINLTNNMIVKIDRNDIKSASNKDIEENIKEVFGMCSKITKGQLIKLSAICDVCFDILFIGARCNNDNTELLFRLI